MVDSPRRRPLNSDRTISTAPRHAPFRPGDRVRWTLGGPVHNPSWCEGVVIKCDGNKVAEMTAERVNNWEGAELCRQRGESVNPDTGKHGPHGRVELLHRPDGDGGIHQYQRRDA